MSTTRPDRAIILAAGQGKRLGALTAERPKCLLEVDGKPIVQHQIDALRSVGIKVFIVVTGFGAEHVRDVLGEQVLYIHSSEYATTNSLYSFYLARGQTADGFVLLNGDVLFHPQVARAVLESPHPDAAAVDFRDGLGEEETKVKVEGEGRIVAITKDMPPALSDGENVGLLKFSGPGARRVVEKTASLVSAGARRAWVIAAFHAMVSEHPIYAVPTSGLPWIEIDFIEDLQRAVQEIAPRCHV